MPKDFEDSESSSLLSFGRHILEFAQNSFEKREAGTCRCHF
jgi:hypothetical protein